MHKVGMVLCTFLVLAVAFVVTGAAHAGYAAVDDEPPAWEPPADESLLDLVPPDVQPGLNGDEKNGNNEGNSGAAPGNSGNPGSSGDDAPGNSGDAPGNSGDDQPGNSGDAPGNSGNPGNSGEDEPEIGGDEPGNSGDDGPGNSGSAPGNSGDDERGNGGSDGQAGGDDGSGEDGAGEDESRSADDGDDSGAGERSGDSGEGGDREQDSGSDDQEQDGGSGDTDERGGNGDESEGGESEVEEGESDERERSSEGSESGAEEGESGTEDGGGEQRTEQGQDENEDRDGDERDDGDVTGQSAVPLDSVTSPQAQFDTSLEPISDTLTAGERVQITMEVENAGEREGTFETALRVDSETVASEAVPVEAGESETLVFEHSFDEPGEYEIAVGETLLGTLTVTAADDGAMTQTSADDVDGVDPVAAIDVVEATAPSDWVREGYETTVRATVVNTANRTVTRSLTVTVDGQPVANESVTLQPGERDVVHIAFEAVDGDVAVEGVDADRINSSERLGTAETEPTDARDDGVSGFDLAVLIAVISVLACIVALEVRGLR